MHMKYPARTGKASRGAAGGDGMHRGGTHAADDKQREQLRTAQRLWIQYRDANCLYYDLGEGTIARLDAGECMRSMTEARAKELENLGHQ